MSGLLCGIRETETVKPVEGSVISFWHQWTAASWYVCCQFYF